MTKKDTEKYKVWGGKNMLKCDDCSCGNFKCEDGSRFCSRCGVWRIVLALTFFIIMFKIGYICGYQMALADSADEISGGISMAGRMNINKPYRGMMNGVGYMRSPSSGVYANNVDANGCKVSEAATWSKTLAKCVSLYNDAYVLNDVNGGIKISYLLAKDKAKIELYMNGTNDGIILNASDTGDWRSEDGKYVVKKNTSNKFVLSINGNVTQAER